jgi:hypothetical protein
MYSNLRQLQVCTTIHTSRSSQFVIPPSVRTFHNDIHTTWWVLPQSVLFPVFKLRCKLSSFIGIPSSQILRVQASSCFTQLATNHVDWSSMSSLLSLPREVRLLIWPHATDRNLHLCGQFCRIDNNKCHKSHLVDPDLRLRLLCRAIYEDMKMLDFQYKFVIRSRYCRHGLYHGLLRLPNLPQDYKIVVSREFCKSTNRRRVSRNSPYKLTVPST